MKKVTGDLVRDEYTSEDFRANVFEASTNIKILKGEQERVIRARKFEDCNREIRISNERIKIAQCCYDALREALRTEGISKQDEKLMDDLSSTLYSNIVNAQYYLGEIIDLPEDAMETSIHKKLRILLDDSLAYIDRLISQVAPHLERFGYSMKFGPDCSQPGGE